MNIKKNSQPSIFEINRLNKSPKDSPDFQNNKKEVKLPNVEKSTPPKFTLLSRHDEDK